MELIKGTRLGRYEIRSPIGKGGMGEVYLAEDTTLDRTVALKVLPAPVASDEQRMRRFIREAKTASGLNHPNILTIYEIGQTDDSTHFIATEFIEGVTLRHLIRTTRMAMSETFDIAMQVAGALSVAHAAGIVHRDIKPENIMLRKDGYVKVLDFGLAKLTGNFSEWQPSDPEAPTAQIVNTDPGVVMGTVHYMSPEQARGLDVDGRADVWSLAVVLYEMFTGRLPFAGETGSDVIASILEKNPPPLSRFAKEIPPELQRIVSKALAKDREERYQTVKDLLIDLRNLKRQIELEKKRKRSAESKSSDEAIDGGDDAGSTRAAKDSKGKTGKVEDHSLWSVQHLPGGIRSHNTASLLGLLALALLMASAAYYFIRVRSRIDSVAVIPFTNTTGDPHMENLGDGISDKVVDNLSQLSGLRVVPKSTMFRYRGTTVDTQKVASELNVRAVLRGWVVKQGDILIIKTELVDATYDSQIWGEQYTRNLSDLFGGASLLTIQEDISKQMMEKLKAKLER
ncbi:MAG TPA: serine/threonine-protein kinase [Pyrinomonadaceae bacterium]|jgi:serine/threonine-protein kinase